MTAARLAEDVLAAEPPRPSAPAPMQLAKPVIASRWPRHEEDEIAAAMDVLRSGQVNALVHGQKCRAFEQAFSTMTGMPHAVAVANGTLSLELALRALGIGSGDDVIVTPRSFFASAACIIACGARPVFADVDPVSQNVTAASIAEAVTPRTRAIIAVHLAGWPCAMNEIMILAESLGLKVIEDCAQAHGATYEGQPVGSFGDAAAFSFCTDKIISTAGEGGMLVMRDPSVYAKAWAYKDHGKSLAKTRQAPGTRAFRWVHDSFGSNYRLTEFQAAIGLRQVEKLPRWISLRRKHACILDDTLSGLDTLRLAIPDVDIGHARYKYYAFIRPEALARGWTRETIIEAAAASGIPCATGSCPEIYREAAFADVRQPRLAVAKELGETSLMLPIDPTLQAEEVVEMGLRLRRILLEASR